MKLINWFLNLFVGVPKKPISTSRITPDPTALIALKYLFAGTADKWIKEGNLEGKIDLSKYSGPNQRNMNFIVLGQIKETEFLRFWELWTGFKSEKEYHERTGEFPPYSGNSDREFLLWFNDRKRWRYLEKVARRQQPNRTDLYSTIADKLEAVGWSAERIAKAAPKPEPGSDPGNGRQSLQPAN